MLSARRAASAYLEPLAHLAQRDLPDCKVLLARTGLGVIPDFLEILVRPDHPDWSDYEDFLYKWELLVHREPRDFVALLVHRALRGSLDHEVIRDGQGRWECPVLRVRLVVVVTRVKQVRLA